MNAQQFMQAIAAPYEETLRYLVAEDLRALRSGIPRRPYTREPLCESDICGDLRRMGKEVARQRDKHVMDAFNCTIPKITLVVETGEMIYDYSEAVTPRNPARGGK